MRTPHPNDWFEKALRGELSREEEERLLSSSSQSPGQDASLEEEIALARAVRKLPDAPISSNFTAQVLQRARAEARARPSRHWLITEWAALFQTMRQRLVWTAAGLAVAATAYYQYRLYERSEFAQSVAAVSNVAALPDVDVLVNFQAIQQLHQIPRDLGFQQADLELLAALK